MTIIYSFNKRGAEAEYWSRELSGTHGRYTFVPFNHDVYLNVREYLRAQLLDELWYQRDARLLRMYEDLQGLITATGAEALLVDNCFPYHPEFLRTLPIYKVLRTTDGPLTAYDRDFAYAHAYDHVLYHSPAYSRDLNMAEKLQYIGAKRADFWPLALFDACMDAGVGGEAWVRAERDIEIIFVGSLLRTKLPLLARVKKAFGSRFRLHGQASWKMNLYWNSTFGFPGWVRPIPFDRFVPLYRRARIGINVHNRGDYTVGSYRLFELPANGVMQISDGGEHLNAFFAVGSEIAAYRDADDLIDKIRYYLAHDEERQSLALNGYHRVMRDHRMALRLTQAGELIERGMGRPRPAASAAATHAT